MVAPALLSSPTSALVDCLGELEYPGGFSTPGEHGVVTRRVTDAGALASGAVVVEAGFGVSRPPGEYGAGCLLSGPVEAGDLSLMDEVMVGLLQSTDVVRGHLARNLAFPWWGTDFVKQGLEHLECLDLAMERLEPTRAHLACLGPAMESLGCLGQTMAHQEYLEPTMVNQEWLAQTIEQQGAEEDAEAASNVPIPRDSVVCFSRDVTSDVLSSRSNGLLSVACHTALAVRLVARARGPDGATER